MNNQDIKTIPALKQRRRLVGTVVNSQTMPKTVVVKVERPKELTKYHKTIRVSKKFKCHYEKNDLALGAKVVIEQCRPFSKEKKWRVINIIK